MSFHQADDNDRMRAACVQHARNHSGGMRPSTATPPLPLRQLRPRSCRTHHGASCCTHARTAGRSDLRRPPKSIGSTRAPRSMLVAG